MSVSATVAHIRFGYSTPYSVFNELYHGVRILSREMPKKYCARRKMRRRGAVHREAQFPWDDVRTGT